MDKKTFFLLTCCFLSYPIAMAIQADEKTKNILFFPNELVDRSGTVNLISMREKRFVINDESIYFNNDTVINNKGKVIKVSRLKVGMHVTVSSEINDKKLFAKVIKITGK